MTEENLIDDVYHRIKFDMNRLESNVFEKIEVDSFNLSDFWTQFGVAVQALSNEITKISFISSKKPFPKSNEVASMMQEVMQYYSVMRDLYLVLPEEVGMVVYKAATTAVLRIMGALLDVVHSLKDLSENGAKERLILTGTFWDACNAVASLPRSNLEATLKVIEEETALASDARDELVTTIEEDHVNMSDMRDVDNCDSWTNQERDLAWKAVGLVKVTHVCLQRLHRAVKDFGSCSMPQHCMQLDHTANVVRSVSPALDDFVSELYHPIDFPTALENAGKLVEVLHSVLSVVQGSHYEAGINKDVVNNLLHFISYNLRKLDPETPSLNPVPELSNLTFKT